MTSVLKECVDMLMDIYKESIKGVKEIGALRRLTVEETYNLYILLDSEKEVGPIQVTLGEKEFFALIENALDTGKYYEVFNKMHGKVKKQASGLIQDFTSADECIEQIRLQEQSLGES